jgi:hypothetical protein
MKFLCTMVLALLAVAAAAQETEAKKPPIVVETASAPGASLRYLTIPWGPATFADMETGGESFYAKRTWPFAQLETKAPLSLEGKSVPAGNYALVFHPNTPDKQGMSLEVRRIDVPEFLQPGNVMTKTPEGETVAKVPIRFETTGDSAPALKVGLEPEKDGLALVVRYGNRKLVKELQAAGAAAKP